MLDNLINKKRVYKSRLSIMKRKRLFLFSTLVLINIYARAVSAAVDSCAAGQENSCDQNARCINYFGGYQCDCNIGYEGPGTECQNTDECRSTSQQHACVQNAICTDTDGSYTCSCDVGYTGEGRTLCSDIDECEDGFHNCHENAVCTNSIGSFNCQCMDGFRGNGTHCLDIDECEENSDNCKLYSTCVNTIGSFDCPCDSGFFGDGKTNCYDIDECNINTDNCSENALCQNEQGSFSCTCNDNFVGNGVTCYDGCSAISIQGNAFNFTIYDKYAFSTNVCDNGRPTASVQCIYNTTSEMTEFDHGTLVQAGCELTIQNYIPTVELNYNPTDENLETITRTMYMLTNTDTGLDAIDPANVTDFFDEISDVVTKSMLQISLRTLENVALTTSILAQSNMTNGLGNSLVQSLEDMASNVAIEPGQNELSIETDEISIVVNSFNSTTITGEIIHDFETPMSTSNSTPTVSISLPSSVVDQAVNEANSSVENVQSTFFLFESDELFPSNENAQFVVSASLHSTNTTITIELNEPITVALESIKGDEKEETPIPGSLRKRVTELQCSSWDKTHEKWSTKGQCRVEGTKKCKFNYLSSYTVLVNHKVVDNDFALALISTVGCGLSVLGLGVTIGVHIYVRKVRRLSQTQVFLHLCSMLAISYVIFLFGVGRVESKIVCTSVATLLHYVLTSTWCWMAVYSHSVYNAIIQNQIHSYMKKAGLFAYGTPIIPVVLTAVMFLKYGAENEIQPVICGNEKETVFIYHDYRSESRCWLYGNSMLYGFTIPCSILLLFNIVTFVRIMRKIVKPTSLMKSTSTGTMLKREFVIAVTMSTVIGFSWIIGYLMLVSTDVVYNKVMSWLFAVSSSTQGFLIFLLTALRRDELRKVWYDPLQRRVVRPLRQSFSRFASTLKTKGNYDIQLVSENSWKNKDPPTSNLQSYGKTATMSITDHVTFNSTGVSSDKCNVDYRGKEIDQFEYKTYENCVSEDSDK